MNKRMLGLTIMAGLVVGSLVPGSAAADPPRTNFEAVLSGDEVVPGPGAPDGSASAGGTLWPKKPSQVCVAVGDVQGAERPFTAEIHRAPAGETGPAVATIEFGEFGSACGDADKKVLQHMAENFEQYYLDIHTEEFPDGAMRGQLHPR